MIIPAFLCAVPVVVWLYHAKQKVLDTVLTAQARVLTEVQRLVLVEAIELINLVEDRLPVMLCQAGAKEPRRSRFDVLCTRLAELDSRGSEDRHNLAMIFGDMLSGLMASEAKRLAEAAIEPRSGMLAGRGGIERGFPSATVWVLADIAKRMRRLVRRARFTSWLRRTSLACLGLATVSGLSIVVGIRHDTVWASWVCTSGFYGFFGLFGLGILSTVLFFLQREQIENDAGKYGSDTEPEGSV